MSTWNATWPLDATKMCGSTEQIRDNWDVIEKWWDVEHHTLTSATSGKHSISADNVGVLLTATSATIVGLTTPGTGAIAYDTNQGIVLINRYDSVAEPPSAGFDGLTDIYFARLRTSVGTQSIPATAWTKVVCAGAASETYDSLSGWSSFKYTSPGAYGLYFVTVKITWPETESLYNRGLAIYKNGSAVCKKFLYGSGIISMSLDDVVSLTTGDYIDVRVWHNHTSSVNMASGIIHISRVC